MTEQNEYQSPGTGITYRVDLELAQDLETGLEDYLYGLLDGMDGESDEPPGTESGIPFCGCSVCVNRETLAWLLPRILRAQAEDRIAVVRSLDVVP